MRGNRGSYSTVAYSRLSPRMRGNQCRRMVCARIPRSIPAYAGEPSLPEWGMYRFAVYPRVCGGTMPDVAHPVTPPGLSPRMRGNPRWTNTSRLPYGSIPAYAGEPAGWRRSRPSGGVYPRVCGGTRRDYPPAGNQHRLSPRMRGNLERRTLPLERWTSIPACAGEPADARCTIRPSGVYPRVCGGTVPYLRGGLMVAGLSPRVRGNLRGTERGQVALRSIPACAGEPRR